jgi:predicted nucleic acid-binding protein
MVSKTKKCVFWDTSGWYTLFVQSESLYLKAKDLAQEQIKNKIYFLTSDYVVQETMTLFMARKESSRAIDFWNLIQNSNLIQIEKIDLERFKKSGDYFCKHLDQNYSFVDASSFLLMKECKTNKVVTLDKHFNKAGFQVLL